MAKSLGIVIFYFKLINTHSFFLQFSKFFTPGTFPQLESSGKVARERVRGLIEASVPGVPSSKTLEISSAVNSCADKEGQTQAHFKCRSHRLQKINSCSHVYLSTEAGFVVTEGNCTSYKNFFACTVQKVFQACGHDLPYALLFSQEKMSEED